MNTPLNGIIEAIRQAHDESLNGEHHSARAMLRDSIHALEQLAAPQPAQPAAQAVAPVLVRDVAEVLGVSVAHINSALIVAGCAPRSTNMEISGEELLAVAAAVKAAAPVAPPAVQPLTPLTDEQIDKLLESERMRWSTRSGPPTYEFAAAFARAIERAHGIGTLGGIGDSKGGAE